MKRAIILALTLFVLLGVGAQESLPPHTLDKVTIYSGKKRHKKLLGKGQRMPGARTVWTPDKIGAEVGSIVQVKHPFEVEEIIFGTLSCSIDSLVLRVEIRNTLSLDKSLLDDTLKIDVPKGGKQTFSIVPRRQLIIEPGEYFLSVVFTDCSTAAKERWSVSGNVSKQEKYKMSKEAVQFPLHFKKSYTRATEHDTLESIPVNLGLKVRGIEYR